MQAGSVCFLSQFQFHKGTIRTAVLSDISDFVLYFNSIKVRLELYLDARKLLDIIYFNSIKVRLEHHNYVQVGDTNLYFNSIKVRLELYEFTNNLDKHY